MRNPITKLTLVAAAILAVAGIAGVVMWTHTGSGIALADVLAQVEQIPAYMFQMTITASAKDPNSQDTIWEMKATNLLSQDGRMKAVMKSAGPNGGTRPDCEMYMLPKEKVMIVLMPDEKQYMRTELDDALIEKSRQEHYDPSTILKEILARKHESLGRSTVDGVEVEGFETTDPNDPGDYKIWVDVKTQLPVRVEMDVETVGMRARVVSHDFQWNYPVDANTFKAAIPADYTTMFGGNLKMPAINEEGAIAGLKLCADLTGRYPEKLDHTAITSLMSKLEDKYVPPAVRPELSEPPELPAHEDTELLETLDKILELPQEERHQKLEEHIKKSREEFRKWEEQTKEWEEQVAKREEQFKNREEHFEEISERTDQMMNKLMPMQGAVIYYQMLAQEKKDPAYYGNVVTPQDADKVLMRWKVSDNQYRVIFGSLHAETVDTQTLAELEKDLPK